MSRVFGWFFLILAVVAVSVLAYAQQTITVPDDYPAIQAAIDAAQAGDTVYVKAGRYTEDLVIDKALHLIGENRTKVIIQSPDVKKNVITVDLSRGIVEIEGIEVSGGYAGIYVNVAADSQVKITSIIAYENKYGVVAFGNGALAITASYLIDSASIGLQLENASATVRSNEILRGGIGILLIDKVDIILEGNLIGRCRWGIYTYTTGCGWEKGEPKFSGAVTGTGNRVYGLKTDLCADYPGPPWPDGFVDTAWRDAVAKVVDAYNRGVSLYNDQDYEGALAAYTAGLRLLADAPFPLLEAYFDKNIGVVYDDLGRYANALSNPSSTVAAGSEGENALLNGSLTWNLTKPGAKK